MLEVVSKLFSRRDPRQEAKLGLARIISRYDMTRLSYEQGISDERRSRDERYIALGVWLFPCEAETTPEELNISNGVPAVTYDLRSGGLGVMTPMFLNHKYFVVAVPDEADSWKFFRCEVRHNSIKPGNWYLLGMQVDIGMAVEGARRIEFKQHISHICAEG